MEPTTNNFEGIRAALDAGQKIGELQALGTIHVVEPNGTPFLLKRAGYDVHDVEKFLLKPTAARRARDGARRAGLHRLRQPLQGQRLGRLR
jgi:hypothetical protein